MADPAVPPVPDNPFAGGGTEKNIDQQRVLLNDLVANAGQSGRKIYERQGAEAQGLLQERLGAAGQVPDARRAVYDAFTRDAQAAETQQTNTMKRQAQLGDIFMNQAKAAVPIYAKNVDATTEAMRLQFDERRRREQEQAQLQREAAAASRASARASSRSKAPKTTEELVADNMQALTVNAETTKQALAAGLITPAGMSLKAAKEAGIGSGSRSLNTALTALGVKLPQAQKRYSKDIQTVSALLQGEAREGYSWDEISSQLLGKVQAMQANGDFGATMDVNLLTQAALYMHAPQWGIRDEEWGLRPGAFTKYDYLGAATKPSKGIITTSMRNRGQ